MLYTTRKYEFSLSVFSGSGALHTVSSTPRSAALDSATHGIVQSSHAHRIPSRKHLYMGLIIMLPRKFRLTSKKDFTRIFKGGRSVNGRGIGLKYFPSGLEMSRFAFVVSTKVSKKAVVRNKLKRQMREIIHGVLKDVKPGVDMVIIARKEAIDMEFAEMTGSMQKILKKAALL